MNARAQTALGRGDARRESRRYTASGTCVRIDLLPVLAAPAKVGAVCSYSDSRSKATR
jgi:hypothetical protein